MKRLLQRLWKLAATVETWPCHWFSSDFDDPGLDWCWDCAVKRVAELRAKHPSITVDDIDGGWEIEQDTPPWCEGCGRRLAYTPTDHCTEQELDHFYRLRFRKVTPGMAYDLARIFEVAQYVEDKLALSVVEERTKRALTRATKGGA